MVTPLLKGHPVGCSELPDVLEHKSQVAVPELLRLFVFRPIKIDSATKKEILRGDVGILVVRALSAKGSSFFCLL